MYGLLILMGGVLNLSGMESKEPGTLRAFEATQSPIPEEAGAAPVELAAATVQPPKTAAIGRQSKLATRQTHALEVRLPRSLATNLSYVRSAEESRTLAAWIQVVSTKNGLESLKRSSQWMHIVGGNPSGRLARVIAGLEGADNPTRLAVHKTVFPQVPSADRVVPGFYGNQTLALLSTERLQRRVAH